MQILEIWNNFFTNGVQIHSSFFLSYLFLIFCEFQKKSKFDAHLYKFDKFKF
jgi:hypothetical protein